MILKKGLILSEVDGTFYAVAADDAGKNFSGMMKMNKTAAFITGKLRTDTTVDELVAAVLDEYDVTKENARQSVIEVVDNLRRIHLINE